MSQVSTRVRGINALLTVVDFAAGAIGSAEGELAQKDAVIRQLSEQLAAREREKAAADVEVIGLAKKARDTLERLDSANEEIEELVKLIRSALGKRDSLADDRDVSLLDEELSALRAALD